MLWILAIVLILVGVAGTVLPIAARRDLVFGGIVLAAWIDDFTRIPVWLLVVFGLLTAIAWASTRRGRPGAKKAGASKLALIGAAIGTLAGIFTGLWGLLFMPLVGAPRSASSSRSAICRRAGKVGVATWIGLLLGTAVKVAIVFAMVGALVVRWRSGVRTHFEIGCAARLLWSKRRCA